MKKNFCLAVLSVVLCGWVSGCASLKEEPPRYDRVLTYDRPYDYTYLKTLEALNTVPGWALEETDKVKGLIVLRDTEYGHLFDRDKQVARFWVKSLGREQTSVSLDPSSQQLEKGGELLKQIDEMMAAASSVRGEQLAELVR